MLEEHPCHSSKTHLDIQSNSQYIDGIEYISRARMYKAEYITTHWEEFDSQDGNF